MPGGLVPPTGGEKLAEQNGISRSEADPGVGVVTLEVGGAEHGVGFVGAGPPVGEEFVEEFGGGRGIQVGKSVGAGRGEPGGQGGLGFGFDAASDGATDHAVSDGHPAPAEPGSGTFPAFRGENGDGDVGRGAEDRAEADAAAIERSGEDAIGAGGSFNCPGGPFFTGDAVATWFDFFGLPKPDAVVGLDGDGVCEDQLHLARAGDSEGYEGIDGTGVFKGYGWTLDGGDGETDGGTGPARFGGRTVEAGSADGHEMGRLGDTQRQLPGDVVGYLKLYLVAEGGLQDVDVRRPPFRQGKAGFDAESAAAGFEIVADAGDQGDITAEYGGEFDRIDDVACGERSDHRRGQRMIFEPGEPGPGELEALAGKASCG